MKTRPWPVGDTRLFRCRFPVRPLDHAMIRRLIKLCEGVLDRVLGVCGGLVCAFAASLAAFYFRAILDGHLLWFLAASAFSFLLFSLLGLFLFRYFALFFIPVFNFLASGEQGGDEVAGPNVPRFGVSLGFLLTLAALAAGAVFQLHPVFAVGAFLFLAYAIFAPKIFPHVPAPK